MDLTKIIIGLVTIVVYTISFFITASFIDLAITAYKNEKYFRFGCYLLLIMCGIRFLFFS